MQPLENPAFRRLEGLHSIWHGLHGTHIVKNNPEIILKMCFVLMFHAWKVSRPVVWTRPGGSQNVISYNWNQPDRYSGISG